MICRNYILDPISLFFLFPIPCSNSSSLVFTIFQITNQEGANSQKDKTVSCQIYSSDLNIKRFLIQSLDSIIGPCGSINIDLDLISVKLLDTFVQQNINVSVFNIFFIISLCSISIVSFNPL